MDPFLSRFFLWCHVLLENLTAWFDPSFPPFRRIDVLGWESWDTPTELKRLLQCGNWSFFHHRSSTFSLGGPSTSVCQNRHRSPYLHPGSDLWWIKTLGRVPKITWRIRTHSPENISARNLSYCSCGALPSAAWTFWGYLPVSLCLHFWCRRRRLSFLSLIASVSRRGIVTETTRVSFRTLFYCLTVMAVSHLPFRAGLSPFYTLGYCSSFHHFVPGSEVACPPRLIDITSYHCLKSGVVWWFFISNILLVHT